MRLDRLNLVAGRFAGGIPCQPLLAGLQEIFRPAVVEILVDPFLAAQLGDTLLTAQPAITILTFSSAEYCRRVARRISRTVFSAAAESSSAFDLIAAPARLR